MASETFYKTIEEAVKVAEKETNPTLSRYETDMVNMVWNGYDCNNNRLFTVYRTFDEAYKQVYQIRYALKD